MTSELHQSTAGAASSIKQAGAAEPGDFGTALAEGFARRIGALSRRLGAAASSVRWAQRAAFAASRATSAGHVCVPLARLARRYGESPADVRAALHASGVVSSGAEDAAALRPLVIDEAGRLYLARYFDYERRLATALVEHVQARGSRDRSGSSAQAAGGHEDARALQVRVLRYFGPPQDDEVDWQRVAAVAALSGRLTIVSGGPGTGKTTTVVGVLACLIDENPTLRIALAAPTGKAAQRMQEALLAQSGKLPAEIAARLPQTSHTLHRLLGSGPNGRFRHHRGNPLPYDVVVVDEASMIDVAMAVHLVDALAPDTRLVMLGDKDQLAAVEAGAVFAELSAQPAFSASGVTRVAQALGIPEERFAAALADGADAAKQAPLGGAAKPVLLGDAGEPYAEAAPFGDETFFAALDDVEAFAWFDEPDGARIGNSISESAEDASTPATVSHRAPASTPLTDCVIWLERNYRFGLDSPIGRLSVAIRRGDAGGALDALSIDPETPSAAALYEDAGATLAERTVARLAQGFAPYAQALAKALAQRTPDPAPLFDALNRFRVLCATRAGARGVDQLNALMAAHVRRAAHVPLGAPRGDLLRSAPQGDLLRSAGASWFAGRPVMVTRNDYALGLFNGDIGIALPAAGAGADGALRVYFRAADGSLRAVSPAALPPHDTAFALTVHKSQGSEFDHAVLVLPGSASRVLSRELVYTAVTRARRAVQVIGSRAVLSQAIATPTQRVSGLAARIAAALREPT
ncbi:AAA family ATPase [Trinickia mobilis]|uniref:AAA family ATPase n=1 Tax=Trinickia mobilis TaxID=2816356 RepID=UPI001A8E781F|nr:AAA family ATPase [Trinickia mobilis]